MPYSRDSFSSYWLILWVIVFFTGMFFLFSALLGYSPFSPYSGKIKGPYFISSWGNTISIGGEVQGKNQKEGKRFLGKEEFCFSHYFLKNRCFIKDIKANEYSLLNLEDVFLLPRFPKKENLTTEQVFFDPHEEGIIWYDKEKKNIFGIKKGDESIFSLSPEENFAGIFFDEIEKKIYFLLIKEGKKNEEALSEKKYFSFSSFSLNIPNVDTILQKEKTLIIPSLSSFLQKNKEKNEEELLASFSPSAQKIIPFKKGYFLVFEASVWIFFPENTSFQKIFSRDPSSEIFFHEKTKSFFFFEEGVLKRIFL